MVERIRSNRLLKMILCENLVALGSFMGLNHEFNKKGRSMDKHKKKSGCFYVLRNFCVEQKVIYIKELERKKGE